MEVWLESVRAAVERELSCSAHGMDHVMRVYNLCVTLAEGERVDMDTLRAAALLHDVARVREDNDPTGETDHAEAGADEAARILKELDRPPEMIERVRHCILNHRYRTGRTPETLEAKILFDADKLDCLGAIGVARCFVWVGRNNAKIHSEVDVETYARENLGGEINGRIRDKTKHSPYIEFETKLKLIPDKLHTEKARKIAAERIVIYRDFLERLDREVRGLV